MKYISTLIIVAALVAGVYWMLHRHAVKKHVPTPTALVKRGPLRVVVESTGVVQSNLDVSIKCQASGEITKLPFDISDYVKKGQVLVQVDPKIEIWQVESAEANLHAAKASLAQSRDAVKIAQANLVTTRLLDQANLLNALVAEKNAATEAHREDVLLKQKLAAQADFDTAQTAAQKARDDLASARIALQEIPAEQLDIQAKKQAVALQQAQVDADKVNLDEARQNLSYTTVRAPMNGVVSARTAQVGQVISSAITNVGGGDAVLTLSDLSHIFVMASVDESDMSDIRLGQPVDITADAYPGVAFRGRVVQIGVSGTSVSNVVTFSVKIEVLGKNKSLLKPTMTANTKIICAYKKNALQVPFEAVVTHKRRHYCYLSRGSGKPLRKPVTLGLTNGQSWEIKSGLSVGERVLAHASAGSSEWAKHTALVHGRG